MKAARFEYHAPRSIDEVVAVRAEYGDESAFLAGGQSLVPMLNLRLAQPSHVIDLRNVEGLDALSVDDNHIHVGAMVTQRTVERSREVASGNRLLSDAVRLIGHPQTRARGTVVGSIAHADPAAELPATVVALDGVIEVTGRSGTRGLLATEFFAGTFSTTLRPDEFVVGLQVPRLKAGSGVAISEVSRRRGDFATVGVASVVTVSVGAESMAWRVALFGVAATPVLLQGDCSRKAATPDLADVASCAANQVDLASNPDGSAGYRRHLVRRALERTLLSAWADAEGTFT